MGSVLAILLLASVAVYLWKVYGHYARSIFGTRVGP